MSSDLNNNGDFRVPARRAKKRLGQHFLRDQGIVERIVALAGVQAGDRVLEIGPGEGVLSAALLARELELLAVEADADLWAPLQAKFARDAAAGRFHLHGGDILKTDPPSLFAENFASFGPVAVVANIPYQITTPIIFFLIRHRTLFSHAVLMMQEEVAARLTASVDCREYGRLTVGVGLYCDVEAGFRVAPGAFSPPPKVFSRVLRLDFLAEPRYPVADPIFFENLVNRLFSQRRKKIINPLAGLVPGIARDELKSRLLAAGFNPDARPAVLSPVELVRLADFLLKVTSV